MAEYKLEFTRLARVVAERHHTITDVETAIRRDIDRDIPDINKFMFTTVSLGRISDDETPNFIITPKEDGVLKVDVAEYEEMGVLSSGPFKGYKMAIPMPDGRNDEED